MWINIEGPPRTGKHGFAEILSRRITDSTDRITILLDSRTPQSPETAFQDLYARWRNYHLGGDNLVTVNGHASVAVYGPMFRKIFNRGAGELSFPEFRFMEMSMLGIGAVTIETFIENRKVHHARCHNSKVNISHATLDEMTERYTKVLTTETVVPPLRVDFAGSSNAEMESVSDQVIDLGKAMETTTLRAGHDHERIGTITPRVLIGVESINRKVATDIIEAAGPNWRSVSIVDRPLLRELALNTRPLQIFSLGFDANFGDMLTDPFQLAERIV